MEDTVKEIEKVSRGWNFNNAVHICIRQDTYIPNLKIIINLNDK